MGVLQVRLVLQCFVLLPREIYWRNIKIYHTLHHMVSQRCDYRFRTRLIESIKPSRGFSRPSSPFDRVVGKRFCLFAFRCPGIEFCFPPFWIVRRFCIVFSDVFAKKTDQIGMRVNELNLRSEVGLCSSPIVQIRCCSPTFNYHLDFFLSVMSR